MNEPDLWQYLKETIKPIILYGTGNGADKILDELNFRGIKVHGIFASDGFVRQREFRGFKVRSLSDIELEYKGQDFIILLCFGSSKVEVIDYVKGLMKRHELYAPDVPVYGKEIFDSQYFKCHIDDYQYVKSILQDDKSIATLDGIVNYKLSGQLDYLFENETTIDEEEAIIDFKSVSTLIDCGAYKGDTIEKYLKLGHGKIKSVVAVEPDMKSFRKLNDYINNNVITQNIVAHLYNAALSDKVGQVSMIGNKGRGAHSDKSVAGINSTGNNNKITNIINTVTIDEIVRKLGDDLNNRLFIKFDVEGNELSGIEGARNVISKYRPLMVISSYHRTEDLFTIPRRVLEINPSYKVKFRHLPGLLCWDSAYYFY